MKMRVARAAETLGIPGWKRSGFGLYCPTMATRTRPEPLTRRQAEALRRLEDALVSFEHAPSIRELAEAVGRAHSTLLEMLARLEEKGWVRRTRDGVELLHGAPRRGEAAVPVHGDVAAGTPILVVEASARLVDLPNLAAPAPGYGYLRVRGSSMIDAHIVDGDLVLVRRQESVDQGEIAVVLIDEQLLTLKRVFRERGGKVRLQPASERHEPQIYAAERVRVQGRVTGIYRQVS
jgi:repressor LexA